MALKNIKKTGKKTQKRLNFYPLLEPYWTPFGALLERLRVEHAVFIENVR